MQRVVEAVAKVMMKCMGTSGVETLCASANIFVGQTESPLLIRPYLEDTTRSELTAVMIGGFGTIAVGVMGAYIGMLKDIFPDAAGHILCASVMSAPASLLISKIMIPETEEPKTKGVAKVQIERTDANVIDAAASGASLGMNLALNVAAMLLAFLALIAMVNFCLEWLGGAVNSLFHTSFVWNLTTLFGTIFSPLAWILGVPWKDCGVMGDLIGKLIVMNEFVAYSELGRLLKEGALDPRTVLIATYALCGFCNLGSIAIQIGGIGGIAPGRRHDLARLGVRALIGGVLTNFTTACIAGLLISTVKLTGIPPAS
jgi:CNT family concentrative nucleoside transporter